MMLSTARIVSRRVVTANIAPRAVAAVGSTRCMSIADQLGKKVRLQLWIKRYLLILLYHHTNSEVISVLSISNKSKQTQCKTGKS